MMMEKLNFKKKGIVKCIIELYTWNFYDFTNHLEAQCSLGASEDVGLRPQSGLPLQKVTGWVNQGMALAGEQLVPPPSLPLHHHWLLLPPAPHHSPLPPPTGMRLCWPGVACSLTLISPLSPPSLPPHHHWSFCSSVDLHITLLWYRMLYGMKSDQNTNAISFWTVVGFLLLSKISLKQLFLFPMSNRSLYQWRKYYGLLNGLRILINTSYIKMPLAFNVHRMSKINVETYLLDYSENIRQFQMFLKCLNSLMSLKET